MGRVNFEKKTEFDLISEVQDGYGSAITASYQMEIQRRTTNRLVKVITILDENMEIQSKIEAKLTKAIYFLTGVTALLAVLQIILIFIK